MPIGTIVGIAGAATVGSSVVGARAAGKSGRAQERAAEAGIAEQRRQFDVIQENLRPYREAGVRGLAGVESLLALGGGDRESALALSPAYRFRLQEGQRALERSAAARGQLFSGATGRALTRFGQDLASTEYQNEFNRRAALAGIGQSATSQLTQAGLTTASNVGNLQQQIGRAQASSYLGRAGAIQGGIESALSLGAFVGGGGLGLIG